MSIRIVCDTCNGWRQVGHGTGEDIRGCPTCWDEATKESLGYIVKGCENCNLVNGCRQIVLVYEPSKGFYNTKFCTAWEKKDEH